jgi:hypothetical protein
LGELKTDAAKALAMNSKASEGRKQRFSPNLIQEHCPGMQGSKELLIY